MLWHRSLTIPTLWTAGCPCRQPAAVSHTSGTLPVSPPLRMLLSGAEHKGTGRRRNSAGANGSAGGVQSQVSVALQQAGELLISTSLPLLASWKDPTWKTEMGWRKTISWVSCVQKTFHGVEVAVSTDTQAVTVMLPPPASLYPLAPMASTLPTSSSSHRAP